MHLGFIKSCWKSPNIETQVFFHFTTVNILSLDSHWSESCIRTFTVYVYTQDIESSIYKVSHQVLDRNWDENCLRDPVIIVLFWMGDSATRHGSALRGTVPCRVMTHHNISLKFEEFSVQNTVGHPVFCSISPLLGFIGQNKVKLKSIQLWLTYIL